MHIYTYVHTHTHTHTGKAKQRNTKQDPACCFAEIYAAAP